MHILLTGGGSGGHITPLLAVAHELKKKRPDCRLSYVGEKGGAFGSLLTESDLIKDTHFIYAGKFRRYHGESFLQRIVDFRTNFLNCKDALKTAVGTVQAVLLLRRERPDIVFIKGGFIGVPVGLAAAFLGIPFVTHDSDAVPGLANRIIGRWAARHATGMPAEFYNYPKDKTAYVGVPVDEAYQRVSAADEKKAKQALGLPAKAQVLFVTGGSQGSARINQAIKAIMADLLDANEDLYAFHHVGNGNQELYGAYEHKRLQTAAFYDNFAQLATAATVVVTRAGANTMAELGTLAKAAIAIPAPFLANGHQLENARQLAQKQAIIEIDETEMMARPAVLKEAIESLLNDETKRQKLADNLHANTKTHAAKELADLLLTTYKEMTE